MVNELNKLEKRYILGASLACLYSILGIVSLMTIVTYDNNCCDYLVLIKILLITYMLLVVMIFLYINNILKRISNNILLVILFFITISQIYVSYNFIFCNNNCFDEVFYAWLILFVNMILLLLGIICSLSILIILNLV